MANVQSGVGPVGLGELMVLEPRWCDYENFLAGHQQGRFCLPFPLNASQYMDFSLWR